MMTEIQHDLLVRAKLSQATMDYIVGSDSVESACRIVTEMSAKVKRLQDKLTLALASHRELRAACESAALACSKPGELCERLNRAVAVANRLVGDMKAERA